MGLFDGLFSPQAYGGQGGGLLDMLRNLQTQPQIQPSAGFEPANDQPSGYMKVGDYNMPQFGPRELYQPQQAQLPANATPTQGQMPQQQPADLPPALGGGGQPNGFIRGLQSIGNGGGLISALTGNYNDPVSIQRANLKTQFDALVPMVGPQKAMLAVMNPEIGKLIVAQALGGTGQTDDIKEYQFAKREDPSLTFEKFMARKKSVSGEFGMQPIWGTGPDGKPAVLQLGKSGEAKQSVLPPGFNLSRDPVKVEGPTGTAILDPQTRQQVAFIPKDVSGAAKAKEIGEAEGQAVVNLPTVIATAENTLKTIKQMEEHPGKKNWGAFGWGAMLPDSPGGDTRGFGALVDQVKGQNFMTAFQSLKGAGAITEQEGAKAERAQARLDRAQSEKDFDIAVKDLKEVVTAGMERARQKAGIKNNQPAPTATTRAEDPLGIR